MRKFFCTFVLVFILSVLFVFAEKANAMGAGISSNISPWLKQRLKEEHKANATEYYIPEYINSRGPSAEDYASINGPYSVGPFEYTILGVLGVLISIGIIQRVRKKEQETP